MTRARTTLEWSLGAFLLAILLAALLPVLSGGRSMVVRSGSMGPAIRTGDLVAVRPMSPSSAHVGDIVTFRDPDGSGRLLVHRVRAVHAEGDEYEFVTQGDANSTQENWRVAASGSIGAVAYRIPKAGVIVARISSPAGKVLLMIVPALLLGASLMGGIWRRPVGES